MVNLTKCANCLQNVYLVTCFCVQNSFPFNLFGLYLYSRILSFPKFILVLSLNTILAGTKEDTAIPNKICIEVSFINFRLTST